VSALFTSLANLAAQAGFPSSQISVAAAVALAESNGDPNAYNPETAAGNAAGQGSYGLWQINLAAHPEFSSWNLFDPQANANAAYRVWQKAGGLFSPWTTFRSGAYQAFLVAPASSPYAPWASTLTILSPTSAADTPSSGDSWVTLAVATAVIFGLGFLLREI
jgi:Lysozyme like domain